MRGFKIAHGTLGKRLRLVASESSVAQSAKELLVFGDKAMNGFDCTEYGAQRIVIYGTIKITKTNGTQKSPALVDVKKLSFALTRLYWSMVRFCLSAKGFLVRLKF
jgi:hypothetical protein